MKTVLIRLPDETKKFQLMLKELSEEIFPLVVHYYENEPYILDSLAENRLFCELCKDATSMNDMFWVSMDGVAYEIKNITIDKESQTITFDCDVVTSTRMYPVMNGILNSTTLPYVFSPAILLSNDRTRVMMVDLTAGGIRPYDQ